MKAIKQVVYITGEQSFYRSLAFYELLNAEKGIEGFVCRGKFQYDQTDKACLLLLLI